MKEIFVAQKGDVTPIKSAFACIRFLLINATCHNADDTVFDAELQQLGKLFIFVHINSIYAIYFEQVCQRNTRQQFVVYVPNIWTKFERICVQIALKVFVFLFKTLPNDNYIFVFIFSVNELVDINYTIPTESTTVNCAQISFDIANEIRDGKPMPVVQHKVNISKLDVGILLAELRTIDRIMNGLNYGQNDG